MAAKQMDLWTPVVPEAKQHYNFKRVSQDGGDPCRAVISSWADGLTDRDGKFVKEFQTTFDSSFWELYLHACFKDLGVDPQTEHHAPDFMLDVCGHEVAAEATIAREATGFRPEWDKSKLFESGNLTSLPQRVRYTTVRLASRFVSKVYEYRKKYAELEHVRDRPFVLCLAPFDQPFTFDLAAQAMRRVLYRADTPIFVRDPRTGEAVVLGNSEIDEVLKDGGAEIPLGMFCDDTYPEVSAVLFSTTATWCKVRALSAESETVTMFSAERFNAYGTIPLTFYAEKSQYHETLLDGLTLCVNPFATHALPLNPFIENGVAIDTWHRATGTYVSEAPHEWLIRRLCINARPTEVLERAGESSGADYREIETPVWTDGELRLVPTIMFPASETWMAHFRGWTVVVLRDGVDGTWHAFAVRQIAHTIPEVREINQAERVPSMWRLDDHESKDGAFADITQAIAESEAANK